MDALVFGAQASLSDIERLPISRILYWSIGLAIKADRR